MNRFKRFATNHPILFGLVITFIFIVFVILAGIFAYPAPTGVSQSLVSAAVMFVGWLVFLAVLWRFNWLWPAGVTNWGNGRFWLRMLPLIIYCSLVFVVGFFWEFRGQVGLPELGVATAVTIESFIDGGFLQEFAFRALILYALVRLWGHTRRGLTMAVFISALFFGLVHFFNIINLFVPGADGAPVTVTMLQVLTTIISGVYLAVFVLYGGAIWPVVLIHGLGNAIVSVLAVGTPGFHETTSAWVISTLLLLPVLLLSLYLLRRMPLRSVDPDLGERPRHEAAAPEIIAH